MLEFASKHAAGCHICGAKPTVESHIIPKALMHDLRSGDPFLHEVTQDRIGTRFLQSGPVDNQILCLAHEQQTQVPDRYGIEFCRRVITEVPQNGQRAMVSNPKPELLVRFACLSVWRHCVSKYGQGIGALGPYGEQLRAVVFDNSSETPILYLARNHMRVNGTTESTIAIPPFQVRLAAVRCWLFSFSGVQFYLKLDQRALPGEHEGFAANGADPVTLLQLDPMLAQDIPIMQSLMVNMLARRN